MENKYIDNRGLEYKIIEDLGVTYYSDNYHSHKVKIKYTESGYESIVELKSALNGSVKDNSNNIIDYNKIYNSLSGDYKIIEDLGTKNKQRYVRIKYINSGNEYIVRSYDAFKGNVRDNKIHIINNINSDKIYNSKYGEYKIINKLPNNRCIIKFINSGFEKNVKFSNAKNGIVKDPYFPNIFGIACIGNYNGEYKSLLYSIWHNMISRCYNINDSAYYRYGAIGVTVDNKWLCFENFANDVQDIQNWDEKIKFPNEYELDKDLLQQNIPLNRRIYSKNTCIWINKYLNSNLSKININDTHIYGVRQIGINSYSARYSDTYLGTFSNEIAAANAYNHFKNKIEGENSNILLNKVPYMSPDEFIKYNNNPKIMCKIIKDSKY